MGWEWGARWAIEKDLDDIYDSLASFIPPQN